MDRKQALVSALREAAEGEGVTLAEAFAAFEDGVGVGLITKALSDEAYEAATRASERKFAVGLTGLTEDILTNAGTADRADYGEVLLDAKREGGG